MLPEVAILGLKTNEREREGKREEKRIIPGQRGRERGLCSGCLNRFPINLQFKMSKYTEN